MPPALLAGFAEADITPSLGGSMPGYFADRQATGTLDPLMVRAVVLRQGDRSVALVTCDLIAVGAETVRRIRDAVAAGKDAPGQVWVHASHTHTGGMLARVGGFTSDAETIYPGFFPGTADEKWAARLVERTADAVARAQLDAAGEARVSLHAGRESTVAHYRRYVMKDGSVRTNPGRGNPAVVRPAGEIDPRLHVVRFGDRKILAVIYGLHPDCVGGTRYSADYPGHVVAGLRHALGAEWRVVFLNAACGNINHVDVNDKAQKSGPEESKRIGDALTLAALEALKKGTPLDGTLGLEVTTVTSRLRKPGAADLREAERLLKPGEKPDKNPFGFNELFAPAALVLGKTKDREHPAEVAALRLGSFGLAFLPGEMFVELAREVEDGSPFRPTRTIGLANGYLGYIPTRRGFAEGGYEAGYRSARYEPDTGHRWAAAAVDILKGLK